MDLNTCSIDTSVEALGTANIVSPIAERTQNNQLSIITDDDRVLFDIDSARIADACRREKSLPALECAGPRRQIYFDPCKIRCALVTCGGICPGLNAIIRSVVLELFYGYGVQHIYGIRYGLQGFIAKYRHDVMELSPEVVANIMKRGGTILGSSRGEQDVDAIVDCLERLGIGALFMIGGDGTLVAATRIADAILSRQLKISVIGIPKTIDNDIHMVSRSFGFDTAVDVATQSIRAAHNEAVGYPNGIGLIKLMGRYSGFIAATATLADQAIDALALAPDGRLVISTKGSANVPGAVGKVKALDKDLLVLDNGTFGSSSSGTWSLYFDGSDVGLTKGREVITGVEIDPLSGKIYLSLLGRFVVPGLSGNSRDIVACTPASLGATTQCAFEMFWQGSDHDLGRQAIDGLEIR